MLIQKLKEIDERTEAKDEGNDQMVNQQMMESQMYGQGMLALPDAGMGMGMMPGQMGQMGNMVECQDKCLKATWDKWGTWVECQHKCLKATWA